MMMGSQKLLERGDKCGADLDSIYVLSPLLVLMSQNFQYNAHGFSAPPTLVSAT